ncbi:DUF3667 domain-containing protein [Roseivirga pacifica]|uniref:DUF3667 domain-containing protein n=1 Tax=Roseivirga pacifica TaxID=1267423 RepID=UPI002094ECEF|nr:DUF3667 domain-containing protein [Roseivirga pacifica]MCO6357734.1 DUF3667 domain-containing protein [Roseivirga pacifica]MCO6365987.1 DUF3667 domain-containing protein [Roseivirga pacifica]MCO6378693.1 DUF3667 domain-containing protein [Roseivirga pacifica]
MKEKQRRSTTCKNCDSTLEEGFNFCPVCGQSNSDNNVSFTTLIKEFLDNYFGIDSKMAHSAVPFLFKPGALTNRFQEGKVKHFIHPVRLYLVMSLFYFFTISYLLSDFDLSTLDDRMEYRSAAFEDLKDSDELKMLSDSVKFSLLNDTLVSKYPSITNFAALIDTLEVNYGEDFIEDNKVSLEGIDIPISQNERYFDKLHRLARDHRVTDDQFMDSLANGDSSGGWNMNFFGGDGGDHVKQQVRKIFENDQGFKGFVLGNLPLMMFLLIPLFAGVLKMVYVRRSHLYIKHIVHALHVHSFAYLIYGIILLVAFKVITEENFPNADIESARAWPLFLFFVLASTYTYISFLKVYKQGWFKTLIKFNIVGFVYLFLLSTFFGFEVYISFWYY